jgi:hypothetical protein
MNASACCLGGGPCRVVGICHDTIGRNQEKLWTLSELLMLSTSTMCPQFVVIGSLECNASVLSGSLFFFPFLSLLGLLGYLSLFPVHFPLSSIGSQI